MSARPSALATLLALAASCAQAPAPAGPAGPLAIATWPFGKLGNDRALEALAAGGTALDAVEQGVRAVEALGPDGSVGLAGRPNAAGYVQLDACIMNGPDHAAGSVAGLEGIVHPISAARRVMERTPHVMLVGEGARWFALEQGLETVDVRAYEPLKQAWIERGAAPTDLPGAGEGHDTVAVLVLDARGDLAGGCSTSGAGRKLPGRVGDSPILGSGLYVDNEVGAAGATGLGENIMRHCGTFLVVELMRQGLDPQAACEEAIHRIAARDPRGYDLDACFVALDRQGRCGAASSNDSFPFAVAGPGFSEVRTVAPVVPRR
jgi:isoaspartyl peptidase/L-asparaginase-like protein (Ntn-hydrolase superfamily)